VAGIAETAEVEGQGEGEATTGVQDEEVEATELEVEETVVELVVTEMAVEQHMVAALYLRRSLSGEYGEGRSVERQKQWGVW
jgi:hypothetical protein